MTNDPDRRSRPGDAKRSLVGPSRRDVLKLGGAALALGAAGPRLPAVAGAQDAASPTADVCMLTPEQTEGPYYLPFDLVRQDITEDRVGVPLRLRIAVIDVNSCAMLENAAVDVWHCDAQGFYSGVVGNPGAMPTRRPARAPRRERFCGASNSPMRTGSPSS